MTIQRGYIHCLNCGLHIALPLRSHLGKFDGQINPSKDIWPISLLCLRCERLSVIPSQGVHLKESETQGQYQLTRYDFSSDQSGSLRHVVIYTQEISLEALTDSREYVPEDEAVSRILVPSGLWQDSYGSKVYLSIDRGCEHNTPKSFPDLVKGGQHAIYRR